MLILGVLEREIAAGHSETFGKLSDGAYSGVFERFLSRQGSGDSSHHQKHLNFGVFLFEQNTRQAQCILAPLVTIRGFIDDVQRLHRMWTSVSSSLIEST